MLFPSSVFIPVPDSSFGENAGQHHKRIISFKNKVRRLVQSKSKPPLTPEASLNIKFPAFAFSGFPAFLI